MEIFEKEIQFVTDLCLHESWGNFASFSTASKRCLKMFDCLCKILISGCAIFLSHFKSVPGVFHNGIFCSSTCIAVLGFFLLLLGGGEGGEGGVLFFFFKKFHSNYD